MANKVRGMKKTIMRGKNVGKKIGKGLKSAKGAVKGVKKTISKGVPLLSLVAKMDTLFGKGRVNGGRARLAFSRVTIDAEKEGN